MNTLRPQHSPCFLLPHLRWGRHRSPCARAFVVFMATAGWIFATSTASKAAIPATSALSPAVAAAILAPPAALTLGVGSAVVRALGRRMRVEGSEVAMQQLARRVSAVERR